MKDVTMYVLCYAAILAAAISVMGLLASTAEPARARQDEPQVAAVQPGTAHVAATFDIPF